MFGFFWWLSSNICNIRNCYLLLLQYHAIFLRRVKNKKCSLYALPYVSDMKSLRTFSCPRKDFNLTAHLVQSIVLSLAQYLTTFTMHPSRTTTRKVRLQYTFHQNNWCRLKAHKWKINQYIPDSFSLESLLKRDFFLFCLKYMGFRSLCFLASSYASSHCQKNFVRFQQNRMSKILLQLKLVELVFLGEVGVGAGSHLLYSSC